MPEPGPNLAGKDVTGLNASGARLRNVFAPNAKITSAYLVNASIEGDFEGVTMNGVLVAPLIEAEIERQHPVLKQLRTLRTADELRANLEVAFGLWDALIERASALDEVTVHAHVDLEWSFVETLRHLVYATDAWFRHVVLDLPEPYHALALSHTEARGHDPGIDLDASPSLAEVVAVWRANQDELRAFAATLTDDDLATRYEAKASPGHPYGDHSVRTVFWVVNNELYWHSTYATRDLDALTAG
ncbi:MAG TPA: DinB family protein [Acidimicrobiales bacterium]|nr:DinB family protein [Acidimicrobiales bacterium]